jgi:hypothetical protein
MAELELPNFEIPTPPKPQKPVPTDTRKEVEIKHELPRTMPMDVLLSMMNPELDLMVN